MEKKLWLLSAILVFSICLSLATSVKANSIIWSKTQETVWPIGACSLVATPDGGCAFVRGTRNNGSNLDDFLLIKMDSLGNNEWNQTYGGTGNDQPTSLVLSSDGGYAIAGLWNFTYDYKGQPLNCNLGLVKSDKFGNMEWNWTYEGIVFGRSRLVELFGGGYILTGLSGVSLIKIDASGRFEWNKTYALPGTDEAVVAVPDGGYVIAGTVHASDFDRGYDYFLAKIDASGFMEWNQTYRRMRMETATMAPSAVVVTSDGGFAIAGTTAEYSGSGAKDCWLTKTDKFGNLEWSQIYGVGANTDVASSMVATADGGFAIVGATQPYESPTQNSDIWVIKTNSQGNMEWNQTIGGEKETERGYAIAMTIDGGLIVAGDYWIVKIIDINGVPEFSQLTIPVLVTTATLFILIGRKRLPRKST